jgi:ADP-ribose pyrophosphatase YjhB (NUDIX family)
MESLVNDIEGADDDAHLEVKEKCGKMVMEQIKKREEQLKLVLQKVERDIRTTFSKTKMIASSTLEQTMGLEGDRLVLSYSLET